MKDALVILSGGQDSTTCAVIARNKHDKVYGVTFNYGQKHLTEIQSAIKIADKLDIELEIIDLGSRPGCRTESSECIELPPRQNPHGREPLPDRGCTRNHPRQAVGIESRLSHSRRGLSHPHKKRAIMSLGAHANPINESDWMVTHPTR